MAQEAMDYQGGLVTDAILSGSWNPALRPDRSPKKESFSFDSTGLPTSTPDTQILPPVDKTFSSNEEVQDSEELETHNVNAGKPTEGSESAGTDLAHSSEPLKPGLEPPSSTGQSAQGFEWGPQDDDSLSAIEAFKSVGKENLDTAWETTDSGEDPFQSSNFANRTNSFPDMVPSQSQHSPGQADHQSPSHLPPLDTTTEHMDSHADNNALSWDRSGVDGLEDPDQFFNQLNTQTKPIYNPGEAESRFEEGVPLVNHSEPTSPEDTKQPNTIDSIFEGDQAEDDTGFFSSTTNGRENHAHKSPPAFERKSTQQVLDTLHFDPESSVLDSPIDAQDSSGPQQDGADKSQPNEVVAEEDLAKRWEAALSDDDLLLSDNDEEPEPLPDMQEPTIPSGHQGGFQQTMPSSVNNVNAGQPRVNPYTPHQPPSSDLLQGLPISDYSMGSGATQAQQQSSAPASDEPQTFVNRPKAGYKSPYDIPIDISRPRHPPRAVSHPVPNAQPPPRDSSMASIRPTSSGSPYATSTTMPPPPRPGVTASATQPVPPSSSGGESFFAELPPTTSRSRPSSQGQGKYAPRQPVTQPLPPSQGAQAPPMATAPPPPPQQQQQQHDPYAQYQLQKPERMDPYSTLSVPPTQSGPAAAGRYSPKPPALQPGSKPPSSPRYSPAPPQASGSLAPNRYMSQAPSGPQPSNALPFQPRTSSPLAHREEDATLPNDAAVPQAPTTHPERTSMEAENARNYAHPPTSYQPSSPPRQMPPTQPHPPVSSGPVYSSPETQFSPPKRSQTQSPGRRSYEPSTSLGDQQPFPRAASVHGHRYPGSSYAPHVSAHTSRQSEQLDFIPPTDGREHDPLERWKGSPVFKFGFGGTVVSSFPKHIPRYTTGNVVPKVLATVGEIRIHRMSDVVPSNESVVKFPGPLRSKSKKKDVIAWLSSMIASFENNNNVTGFLQSDDGLTKQQEENILLWKVVKLLVEHDGVVDGNPEVQKHVRDIFSSAAHGSDYPTQVSGSALNMAAHPDSTSPELVFDIRKDLLAGDRDKAVWKAVDRRLWGHAMLIASTLDKSIWKQVIQEFIRREVKAVGANTESLAALYEVFAGNLEESIDELVPPSARAGLQMFSKVQGSGPQKNALDGLDKWQETLSLILNNRSPDDQQALLALSCLLASYGRIKASHVCGLFARPNLTSPLFSGPDDPHANIVLLGADHHRYPFMFHKDRNAILLTEVYEFAVSVLGGASSAVLPHFAAMKLQHAISLAEEGYAAEAQQYCDAIGGMFKSTTKPSPYYHQRLFYELDELSNRLRQTPSDGSSSWISKPSMEKVSGSMWAKFSSFVAGDDSDNASTGSGKAADADVGPFAKVAGTPPVSRSPSVAESHGSYFPGHQAVQSASASRYAPGSQYAPYSSPDQLRGRRSLDSQRSPSYGALGRSYSQRRASHEQPPTFDSGHSQLVSHSPYNPPPIVARHSTPPQSSYAPLAPVEENYTSPTVGPTSMLTESLNNGSAVPGHVPQPTPFVEEPASLSQPNNDAQQPSGYAPPTTTSGYEPQQYEPMQANDQEEAEEKPKKKAMMDDDEDDDFNTRVAALKKAEMDRQADEAFKKAAEEDAKKDSRPAEQKGGWISRLFGGKKSGESAGPGPIRAKLGEENSFYYDKELKRWVNKKDPDSANVSVQATPPPPKGSAPPSRSASAGNPPPPSMTASIPITGSAPALVSASPGSDSPQVIGVSPQAMSPSLSSLGVPPSSSPHLMPGMPRSVSAGASSLNPASVGGPPSRPGTALSNASSIDDLLGAPQGRKANTMKTRKKGRGYVDVMAK